MSSIEISRDIMCWSVRLSCPKCIGGITWPKRLLKVIFGRLILNSSLRNGKLKGNCASETEDSSVTEDRGKKDRGKKG